MCDTISDDSQLDFREEVIRQLAGISDDEEVPVYEAKQTCPASSAFTTAHIPQTLNKKLNCKVVEEGAEGCMEVWCTTMQWCCTVPHFRQELFCTLAQCRV